MNVFDRINTLFSPYDQNRQGAAHASENPANSLFSTELINKRLIHTDIKVQVLDECESTNVHLFQQIKQRINIHGQAVLANKQTQGKGRQGKEWAAPTGGSLPLSLAWHFPPNTVQLSALPLLVAFTVWQVLSALGVPAQIKWPNDLVIEQSKLGGILVESVQTASGVIAVIGIGLNLKAPKLDHQPTLGIWDYAPRCEPNHLASFLLLALNQSLQQFQKEGFSLFKKAYLNACRDINRSVVLWHNKHILAQGIMHSVDDSGALILATPRGNQLFTVGEISLRSSGASL